MNKIVSVVMLALILISTLTIEANIKSAIAEPTTIIVPDDYPTLQAAINAASPGDVVLVKSGIYYENIVINKSISLIGEGKELTIIDGLCRTVVVMVEANGVLIRGFTIQNGASPEHHGFQHAGIGVRNCSNVVIKDNVVKGCDEGIWLLSASNCVVEGNMIYDNYCPGVKITRWFWGKPPTTIFPEKNLITNNTITGNFHGLFVSDSSDNKISRNVIKSNKQWGISLYDLASSNEISENTIADNQYGIYVGRSENNKIYHNNLINNEVQAYVYKYEGVAPSNFWDDGYPSGGNYWSDYAGVDEKSGSYQNETGSDGIGDIPYVINEDNVDRYPLMRPWQPTPTYLNGVDVSHWQGNINWLEVYSAGYRFVFVKASEGVGWADPNFVANMENGRDAGLFMGAYHFARTDLGNNPEDEAYYFINVASGYLCEGFLRPVLDLEVGSSLGKEALSNWVRTWMETVKNETGIEPIIYVNSNYANNYLDESIAHYNLWIAHWTYDPSTPPNTGIWNSWDFWQYSNNGSVPGITGYVDLDLFNGDEEKLNREFKIPNLKVLNVTWEEITYPITISSNSSVTHLVFNQQQAYITLNVSGPHGSKGYCNVTIPKELLKGPWTFTIEGDVSDIDIQEAENETHSFLYFIYSHTSTFLIKIQGAWVVPEYPTAMLPILLLLITILTVIINKKARKAKDT